MEKIGILPHHFNGILTGDFAGINEFSIAKIRAIELVMDRFRLATYPNTSILIYPFIRKTGYNPDKLATAIAFAALTVNQNRYTLIPEYQFYAPIRNPEIICRGCGNLVKKPNSNTEYLCLSIETQKHF